ncbi:open rectifier potassium channel protein 1 [Anoplophora glabripennis]|uniref:open rectifier potassium channel protein 1 n=1 Tax=Anoplophora glabripennis TaxID=217634 RepID=UPI0008747C1C|nr:open rectifier potassium channel protein 1 [Anoplophora glabripennis]
MMSKKQWFVLLCLFSIYLLLGASIFFYVESEEETRKGVVELEDKQIIEELLRKHYKGDNNSVQFIFNRLTEYCGKPVHYNMSEEPLNYKWDFYNSLFFVITVVSTIGYGNLAPTTTFTRIFMIFYALIGIPMNGIVMVTLGEYFGKSFKKLYHRWKNAKIERSSAKLGLIGQIILYSVPGFTFFIFLPSTIMSVFEGWTYDEAVYYCFVSLTTIGFGDLIAGTNNSDDFSTEAHILYKIFLLVWVIGGLGYVVMVLGFITQGMQSKRVIEIEKMLAENIKKTPQKIRDELRNVLQEFLFLRVKPVYKGEFEYIPQMLQRSQSCPDLQLWRNMDSPTMMRKRAMSECYRPVQILQRVQSDTDLDLIDKELTFRPSDAFMKQKDLLLKVVDALSGTTADVNQLLTPERPEDAVPTFKAKRRRAVSEIRPPTNAIARIGDGYTWYGNDASKAFTEFTKHRQRTYSAPNSEREERPTIIQRLRNRFRIRPSQSVDVEKQAADTQRRGSTASAKVDVSRRRHSTLSSSQEQVLEQTSIADFIRALSAITVPEINLEPEPRRKLGVACLTPPDVVAARRRRMSIRTNYNNRRASLVPVPPAPRVGPRRFSLRPVDENLLVSPPPYSAFPPEARNSFRQSQRRRFSVRPVYTNLTGPVKRQVNKRTDTDSSDR